MTTIETKVLHWLHFGLVGPSVFSLKNESQPNVDEKLHRTMKEKGKGREKGKEK